MREFDARSGVLHQVAAFCREKAQGLQVGDYVNEKPSWWSLVQEFEQRFEDQLKRERDRERR